jgi:hypothetical protein
MRVADLTRIRFTAGPPEVVASAQDRRRLGLHHWVDGTMGIDRSSNGGLVVAPNGPRIARHRLGPCALLDGLEDADQAILHLRDPLDHASGGPLHRDPETGDLLLVYHGERFANGDPDDYWSFLGLAVSHDDGQTFADLGPILTSPFAETDAARHRPVEVGPGGFVVRDGWWYLWFVDRGEGACPTGLGVARASVGEVRDAVAAGRAPGFAKYHRGSFDQPGLGGAATDLIEGERRPLLWFDVAVLGDLDVLVQVSSTVLGRRRWQHLVRVSADGLRWTPPVPLYPDDIVEEVLYVTIDSGGPDQRRIDGDGFDLYRVASSTRYRWDDARLERVRVRWHVAG